ncbi:MAG: substrate-binding domain-containing protein [Ruminococcus sp.]|nr:substrate-binding domain-containing protein [Ruminococcus sp.]
MKRRFIAGLLVIVLGLTGCGVPEAEEVIVTTDVTTTTETTTTEATTTTAKATTTTTTTTTIAEPADEKTFPIIDGSTSTIKLDAYIRAKVFGISIQDASYNIFNTTHSKTFEAFENLVNGKADVVLSVPLADEQKAYAEEKGFEYEAVPVAMEGFVFLVNPENTVQSLTQEQIRKIYSGEITNWKELGGEDGEILPYQRNGNSGSQTYMRAFMGDTPLTSAPKSLVQGEMGAVISMFENYDNSINAIGYSVYSYAAAFAANEGAFSFVEIDGIKPSRTTFIDGTYPLLSETYAFYKKGTTDKSVLDYIELITSEKGQKYVLEAGYIPVMDIEIPPAYTLYEAKGTGPEKPETINRDKYYLQLTDYGRDNTRPQGFLKDMAFETEIQAWIDETIDNLPEWVEDDDIYYSSYIENGLLGISVGDHGYNEYAMMNQLYGGAAVFDIINNKKIENFSDLFYKDTDFMLAINKVIAYDIRSAADMVYTDYTMKCDFFGLCEGFSFDLDEIHMPEDNAFFGFPASFFIRYYRDSDCLDFKEYLTPGFAEQVEFIEFEPEVNSYQEFFYEKDGHMYIYYDYPDVENDRELPENIMIEEAFDAYYADGRYENGTQRVHIEGNFVGITINYEGPGDYYCSLQHKFIETSDLFKDGFIEHLTIAPEEKNPDNLTAEEIFNTLYKEWPDNGYSLRRMVTLINEPNEDGYIVIEGYDAPKLRIDKTWLKDIYQ